MDRLAPMSAPHTEHYVVTRWVRHESTGAIPRRGRGTNDTVGLDDSTRLGVRRAGQTLYVASQIGA
eukprot:1033468-Prymnesium_polylepis.1